MTKANATIQSILIHLVEDTSIPNQTDLWPSIKASLQKSDQFSSHKDKKMKPKNILKWRFAIPATAMVTLILASIFLFATPQGKAFAQDVINLFTKRQTDFMPVPTNEPEKWVNQTPGVPAPTPTLATKNWIPFVDQCGAYLDAHCSIAEIQQLVSFQVYQLAEIPAGLLFLGATGGPDQIFLFYKTTNRDSSLIIYEEPLTGDANQLEIQVGESAEIQEVTIAGRKVEYVKGGFNYMSGDSEAVWDNSEDLQIVRWVDDGILFTVQKSGKNPPMDINSLAALAGQMTEDSNPLGENLPTMVPTENSLGMLRELYNKTVEQAEKEAGFTIHLPSELPEYLTYVGVNYESDAPWVTVFYWTNYYRSGTDGLDLSEQLVSESGDCDLCGFIRGEAADLEMDKGNKVVGMDAEIDEVSINGTQGQYVEGVWKGVDNVGWVWEADPYVKMLRWQKDGIAYELVYWGMAYQKEDLIAFAQKIK